MTALYSSILEANIFTALRAFILSVVDCEVIRAQVNRVSMPKGDFIALTPVSSVALETNIDTSGATSNSIKRPVQINVQIDFYGLNSADRAMTVSTLFRDDYACQSFTASGFDIQPLYAEDAHQMPLISGEEQYVERWTFEVAIQANPILTITQQSANALIVGLLDVERTYPP